MSKRRELEARRQDAQRKQAIQIGVILAVVAVVVIGGAIVLSSLTGQQQQQANTFLPAVKASNKATPPNAVANALAWGPADAPIRMIEWVDYQCPACGQYARNFEQGVIDAFAASGKVRYEVRFMPFLEDRIGGRESRDAAQAVLCAADQNLGWQMHDTLFANQPITGEENIGNYSKARLKEMAATIPGMDSAAFATCIDSNQYEQRVLDTRREGEGLGVQSTPTFIINDQPFPGVRDANDFRALFAQVAPDVQIP